MVQRKNKAGAVVTAHYPNTDPDMISDYYDIEIQVTLPEGRKIKKAYGDAYHDKGHEKTEGFVDCLYLLYGDRFPVEWVDKADREDLG